MTRSTLLTLTALVAVLGLLDALYLTDMAYAGASLTCTIAGLSGCNIVAQSAYSKLLGQPLALYGVLFYGFFLTSFFFLRNRPGRLGVLFLTLLGTIGLLASLYFLYIQVVLIKALCVYCLGSALASFVLFGLLIFQTFRERKDRSRALAVSE